MGRRPIVPSITSKDFPDYAVDIQPITKKKSPLSKQKSKESKDFFPNWLSDRHNQVAAKNSREDGGKLENDIEQEKIQSIKAEEVDEIAGVRILLAEIISKYGAALVVRLIKELCSFNPLPRAAIKLWRSDDNSDKNQSASSFLAQYYKEWIDKSVISWDYVHSLDPKLANAYSSHIRPDRNPQDNLNLPSRMPLSILRPISKTINSWVPTSELSEDKAKKRRDKTALRSRAYRQRKCSERINLG